MGNALRFLYTNDCKPTTAGDSESLGPHGVSSSTVGVSALAQDIFHFEINSQVPEGLSKHVVSSKKAQANWYRNLFDAWKEAKPPPRTPEDAARLVIQTLKRHQKADVEGLLAFYGLPPPHTLVEVAFKPPTSLPDGVKFEMHTLPVDAKAVADGDGVTVYVSTTDPRESSVVPSNVHAAAMQRSEARAEGLLTFYGLPRPHTLVEVAVKTPASLPDGVKFEMHTLPVDAKAVADGDGVTVYVSTTDPRESSFVPSNVHAAAMQRSEARAQSNHAEADAFHKQITDSGYRVIAIQNEEILAKMYRIRLRGIDAPESAMPYGKEAKLVLTKLVQGKSLRVLVYGEDRYGRCVADIYCNGIFVQELMLKKGLAWHYSAYDKRPEMELWEKEARARRVGLWASKNPEKPWDWRKDRREAN